MQESGNRKIDYWKSQLLDLGKRNKMVNYRETARATLKLVSPELYDLYKVIVSEEKELTFQYPIDKDTDIRTYSMLQLMGRLRQPIEIYLGDIKTENAIADRNKTLRHLRNKSRLALEEQGTNILYLSFGFVEWRENNRPSAKWIKSPLILVPVKLILDSLNAPYKLGRYDDDIVVNPTLEYLFETEYGISLPKFDGDIENLNDFFSGMDDIATEKGWRIIRETSIGLLSFLKINMYKDIENNMEQVLENPIIQAMTGNTENLPEIPEELIGYQHDVVLPQDSFQVLSADSSQQDAILFSKRGISFVMQGPPGTGKSQTIANIISEAMADGKKILFVSEKMAALQVVYNRLTELGLGDFCLSLHSRKANKKEILDDLERTLSQKPARVKNEALEELERLAEERTLLDEYAADLHEVIQPLDLSCYQVFGILESLKDVDDYRFNIPKINEISRARLNEMLHSLERYSFALYDSDLSYETNPWRGTTLTSISYDLKQQLDLRIGELIECLDSIISNRDIINRDYYGQGISTFGEVNDYISIILQLISMPSIPQQFANFENNTALMVRTTDLKAKFEQLKAHKDNVYTYFTPDIWDCDLRLMQYKISELLAELVKYRIKKYDNAEKLLTDCETELLRLDTCKQKADDIGAAISKMGELLGIETKLNLDDVSFFGA